MRVAWRIRPLLNAPRVPRPSTPLADLCQRRWRSIAQKPIEPSLEAMLYTNAQDLVAIPLPHNAGRTFALNQPVDFKKHFGIPSHLRFKRDFFEDLRGDLQEGKIVGIVSERGTGKTTMAYDFADYINSHKSDMLAFYVSARGKERLHENMFQSLIAELDAEAAAVLDLDLTGVGLNEGETQEVLLEKKICFFTKYVEDLGYKLILLVDDCPIQSSFITSLVGAVKGQYACPNSITPPVSVPSAILFFEPHDTQSVITHAGIHEIKTFIEGKGLKSYTIPRFKDAHIAALLNQFNDKSDNRQIALEHAIERIAFITRGHAWLVNRMLHQLDTSPTFLHRIVLNEDDIMAAADEIEELEEGNDIVRAMRETRGAKYYTE